MSFEGVFANVLNRWMRPPPSRRTGDGLRLGRSLQNGRPGAVFLANRRRVEHVAILGKSGAGKTNLLLSLAEQHFERHEGFIFFDFHGDATNHLIRIAAQRPDAAEHLVLVDLSDPDRSPGINPLEGSQGSEGLSSQSSELASILRQRWHVDSFGARTEELLRNTLHTLSECGHTIVEVPLLLTSKPFRESLVHRLTNPEVRDYWTERYEGLSEPMKAAFREPLLNKLTEFISEPACRHFLGQKRSTIRLAESIERGDWIVVCLPKGQLRHHAQTLGNLICAHLLFAVLARIRIPEGQRRIFSILCDEVQNLAENANTLITLFAEGRKFSSSLITTTQFIDQVPRELRSAMFSAGTLAIFRVSAADAAVLAPELTGGRARLPRQPPDLGLGEAWVRVGASEPVLVSVPRASSPATTAKASELREAVLLKYSRPRLEIDAEIATTRRGSFIDTSPAVTEDQPGEGQHGW